VHITLLLCSLWSSTPTAEPVLLLRDRWGIPHVLAQTDEGAFYGLGYATARDRAFQMIYSLRIVQGRLAETVGLVRNNRRRMTSIDSDKRYRTFGFFRAAQRCARNLDAKNLRLLQAYCEGVNAYLFDPQSELHPLFEELGVEIERWTPAACIATFWYIGQFFARDGTRELIARRQRASGRRARSWPARDEEAAVVKREDVSESWIKELVKYAREHGLPARSQGANSPRFSHAWVVGGLRSDSGAAVLVSDPQTLVRNPSLWYEFHIKGATFNTRGIGVPGSPFILIGFNPYVAWGVTALGADQADLFILKGSGSESYRFNGVWVPVVRHQELISVKGARPVPFVVRETHLGPIATALCFARPGEGPVALKRIPICETDRDTIQALLPMIQAQSAEAFEKALAKWRFPSVNILFGDKRGGIGYKALCAVPVRSRRDRSQGAVAHPARDDADDWQEILPFHLLPTVRNPAGGVLFSANHRPVESWYPIPLGVMTGGGGDTVRSWRLRELSSGKKTFAPCEVLSVHFDSVNPARRTIVQAALYLRDRKEGRLSGETLKALEVLEPWYRNGARSDLRYPGAALALEINTFFRASRTPLALKYGGGETGLVFFLKQVQRRLESSKQAEFTPQEVRFFDDCLASAWRSALRKYGSDPGNWNERALRAIASRKMGAFEALHGFPSLDKSLDKNLPALYRVDPGTIACQTSQSYTQWVPLDDPDKALSVCPAGQSELPRSRFRFSTYDLWAKGELHPAPLSRKTVEKYVVERTLLRFREPPTYRNPIIERRLADPTVIFYKGTYYLYATNDVDGDRGYRAYLSKDLVHWKRGPVVFKPGRPHVWAPDINRDPQTGLFYLYYTADRTVGVAKASSPLGPFRIVRDLVRGAIDAHFFRDTDGTLYLYYVKLPRFRITVQPMASPVEPEGEARVLLQPESPWEIRNGRVTEGPWLLARRGLYYLLYSGSGADTPDYAVGYAVSRSPMGPFVRAEHNPILHRSEGVFGPGHGCVVEDGIGALWFVYHQKRSSLRKWDRFICMDRLFLSPRGKLTGTATRWKDLPAPIPHAQTVRNRSLAVRFDAASGRLGFEQLSAGVRWCETVGAAERSGKELTGVDPYSKRLSFRFVGWAETPSGVQTELPVSMTVLLDHQDPVVTLRLEAQGAPAGTVVSYPFLFGSMEGGTVVLPSCEPEVHRTEAPLQKLRFVEGAWRYLPCFGLIARRGAAALLVVLETAGGQAKLNRRKDGAAVGVSWRIEAQKPFVLKLFFEEKGGLAALRERFRRWFARYQAPQFLRDLARGDPSVRKLAAKRWEWFFAPGQVRPPGFADRGEKRP